MDGAVHVSAVQVRGPCLGCRVVSAVSFSSWLSLAGSSLGSAGAVSLALVAHIGSGLGLALSAHVVFCVSLPALTAAVSVVVVSLVIAGWGVVVVVFPKATLAQ